MKDLDSLMENYKKLKVITCSSINDNLIRNEALENFQVYKGNPVYNITNQNCLFYYAELFELKVLNENSINYLFENKKKYIFLFRTEKKSKKNIPTEISNKITKKIEKFRISKINLDERIKKYNYSFNELLIYLYSILNEKFEIHEIIDILRLCPLKYTKIIFKEDFFIVKPIFPFIKYYLNHLINKNECENYFKNKSYNQYSFKSHRIKAEYFEYSVQRGLKDGNFFRLPDKDCREITLYEISKMNRITDFKFDLLEGYEIENKKEYDKTDNESHELFNNNRIQENFIPIIEKDEIIDEKSILEEIAEDANESTILDISNLNINSENEIIIQEDNSGFIKEILNNFNINQKSDEKANNDIEKTPQTIDDYRNDIINKYCNDIKSKNELDILVKKSRTNLKKFKGDENIFLTQSKENGECVDYAVLFGEKNEKNFVSFQMKCYGSNTKIKENAMDKIYIKSKIINILFNSMALFNCQIKHWYYYLIFYFYKNNTENNNLNYKEIEKCYYSNITFLLYNPEVQRKKKKN